MARTVIIGRSGTGKSWYQGHYLERAVPKFEHAIHYDIEDEERGLSHRNHDPIFKSFYVDEEFLNGEVNIPRVIAKNKKVRVVPDGLKTDEQIELCGILCKAAMKLGDCHFSCDEAHLVAPNSTLDDRLSRLVTGGRKKGVEWCFTTQRAQRIHKDVFTQTSHGVYFQLTKQVDLDKVDKSTGFNANERLPDLGERRAIIENHNTSEIEEVNTNDLDRERPHVAGDDGKADDLLAV